MPDQDDSAPAQVAPRSHRPQPWAGTKIERTRGGTQPIEFRRDELDVLYDKIGEAIAYARSPHKSRLMSLSRKIESSFEREFDEAFGGMSPEGL